MPLFRSNIVKCKNCSMVYVGEYNILDLKKYYSDNYYTSMNDINNWITMNKHVWEEIVNQILKYKSYINSLLDIGAGTGGFTKVFNKLSSNTKIAVIESSLQALAHLEKEYPNINIIGKFAENSLGKSDSYDVITALQCLEHLDDPLKICCEVYKKINQGGFFFITVPNRFSYEFFFKKQENNLCYNNPTHLQFFSKKTLLKILKLAGFRKIIRLYDFPHYDTGLITKKIIKFSLRKTALSTELRYIAFK